MASHTDIWWHDIIPLKDSQTVQNMDSVDMEGPKTYSTPERASSLTLSGVVADLHRLDEDSFLR